MVFTLKRFIQPSARSKSFASRQHSYWLALDRSINILFSFCSSVLLARSLTVDSFAFYSFLTAILTVTVSIGNLGISSLIIKKIILFKNNSKEVVEIFLKIKTIIFSLIFLIFLGLIGLSTLSVQEKITASVFSLTLLARPFDIYSIWFNANLKGANIFVARSTGSTVALIIKIFLFAAKSSNIIYYSLTELFKNIISAVLFFVQSSIKNKSALLNLNFSVIKARVLLRGTAPLALSAFLQSIYYRVDQIMLGSFGDTSALANYTVSAQFSEITLFIPVVYVASSYPMLISLRRDDKNKFIVLFKKLFNKLFYIGLAMTVVSIIFSSFSPFLYGPAFSEVLSLTSLLSISCIFIAIRAGISKWLIINNLIKISTLSQAIGAIVNVILNFLLIPKYGAYGAAFATTASHFVASYLVFIVLPVSKELRSILLSAIIKSKKYVGE